MKSNRIQAIVVVAFMLVVSAPRLGAALPADVQAKVDAKMAELSTFSTDAQVVGAVKAYNVTPPAGAAEMDNVKWKTLTVLDPFVRSFSSNALAQYLKGKKDESVSEMFVSSAQGTKIAFLSKTSSWSHTGSAKHDTPMSGKTWTGEIEVDESTGVQQVQVGLPVLDGGKPIGSIVIGLSVSKLN